MELETAFYIIAIIYMGLMFLLFIALLVAVLVIKSKVNKLHDAVEEKVAGVKSIASKLTIAAATLRHFVKK